MADPDLPPFIDAWFTQHDGQRESFLREQILSNARALYADHGHRFEVVLSSRLKAGHGFKVPMVVYSAFVVGFWWGDVTDLDGKGGEEEEESGGTDGESEGSRGWSSSSTSEDWGDDQEGVIDGGGEEGKQESEEKKVEREGGSEPTKDVNELSTVAEKVAPEGVDKDAEGMEEGRSGDASPSSKPVVSPDKRRKTLRRRIVCVGEVDCRAASKALETLAKNVVRDAGDWLRGEGQENLLQDFEVLCENNRARKTDDDRWRKDAHDAEVFNAVRLSKYGDHDAY